MVIFIVVKYAGKIMGPEENSGDSPFWLGSLVVFLGMQCLIVVPLPFYFSLFYLVSHIPHFTVKIWGVLTVWEMSRILALVFPRCII